jgi:hypothetical protein
VVDLLMSQYVIDNVINMKNGVFNKLKDVVVLSRIKNSNTFAARYYKSSQTKFCKML